MRNLLVIVALLPVLFIPVQQPMASDAPEMALITVEGPDPGTTATLLAQDIKVVRDMERYLLVVASPEDLKFIDDLGLNWAMLDSPIAGKTYYTVTAKDHTRLLEAEAEIEILRFDGFDAVVAAPPQEAHKLAGAGLEIARVFMRPIRVAREARMLAPPTAPLAPMQADPLIQAMVDSVSSATIDAGVQRLEDFVTRYAAHDSCQAAAEWIKAQYESYGIDSVYFHNYHATYKDNVVAVIPGKGNPDKIVLVGGHYDSYTGDANNAPGADDDASGTICALECARILSQYDFNYTLVFMAFGGEELGLYGSEGYAADAAARGDDIVAAIAVDMIGYLEGGDVMDLDIIDNASSEWIRDLAVEAGGLYVPTLPIVDGTIPGGASSDHASFWAHGYDAILFFEDTDSYSPYIHTANDVVGISYNSSTLAERSVKIAVALMAMIAEPFTVAITHTPLDNTEDTTNPYGVVADIVAAGTLDPDSLLVRYSAGSGWNTLTMGPTGTPDEYEAFIPAQSGGVWVDYYIVAEDTGGNRRTDPTSAPSEVHTFFVGTITPVVMHDFETDQGWTVGDIDDTATTGMWERCDPEATEAQPEDDHTPDPGVRAYITQCAAGSGQGSNDVDGGKTTLFSPVFDLSTYSAASVRYHRWYSNDTGASPETDDWVVDVSADAGSTWVNLETTSSSNRTWYLVEKNLGDYITLTDEVKFRFIAADYDPGSIVEAGVDDFSIVTYEDYLAGVIPPDRGRTGRIMLSQNVPNPFNAETAIRLVAPAPGHRVSLRIFDVQGREVRTLLRDAHVVGSHTVSWDGTNQKGASVAAGIYICRLEADDIRLSRKVVLAR
jgi:hypothetical protein